MSENYEDVTPIKGKKEMEVSQSATIIAQTDDKSIFEWLQELGTSGAIKIKVERKYPREWQGHHIAGFLEEFDEPFEEKDIKARFGGGKYQVKTFRPNPKGGWTYAGAKSFEIEGDPRLSGTLLDVSSPLHKAGGSAAGDDVTEKAMDHMARSAELHQKRAWALEDERRKDRGMDPDMLKLVTDPPALRTMQADMLELRRQLASKDEQLFKMMAEAGKAPTTPSVIEKTFEHLVAGESGRIEAIRTQHESELRTMRENHRHDLDQERSRLQTEIERRERAHEREIGMIRETHGQALKSVEQSYEARLDGFKSRVADLERQLMESKTEIVKLREIKEKGPLDAVEEVVKLKNAMEVLGPAEQEPSSTWERVLQGVMQSPIVQAAASRIEHAPPAPPPPNPQAVEAARKRRAAARAAQQAAMGAVVPVQQANSIELDAAEVAAALQFVENAITNGTEPTTFAVSARTMIPQEILMALRAMGSDKFVEAAKPPDGSILYTQRGRNWLRRCTSHLLGLVDESESQPKETVPTNDETPKSD